MKRFHSKMLFVILFWVTGVLSCNLVFAQSYVVNVERSKISWVGWKQLFGNTVSQKGNLKFKSGSFYKKDSTFMDAFLVMDMTSISHLNDGEVFTDNDVITHLKSESCFFVEKYPDATFQFKLAESHITENSDNYPLTITGTLTIKGIAKTISFPANIRETKKSLTIKAVFQISRKAFNLDLEPFLIRIGGDKMVRDNIDLSVEIFAQES